MIETKETVTFFAAVSFFIRVRGENNTKQHPDSARNNKNHAKRKKNILKSLDKCVCVRYNIYDIIEYVPKCGIRF